MVAFARGFVRATMALLLVCSSGGGLQAQGGLAPRLLSPAPVGVNFGAVGYVYSSGNVLLDEALPLEDTQAGIKTFVKAFNIAGLPILVVIFGLGVWFRRHSRKKHIQMMFQK